MRVRNREESPGVGLCWEQERLRKRRNRRASLFSSVGETLLSHWSKRATDVPLVVGLRDKVGAGRRDVGVSVATVTEMAS